MTPLLTTSAQTQAWGEVWFHFPESFDEINDLAYLSHRGPKFHTRGIGAQTWQQTGPAAVAMSQMAVAVGDELKVRHDATSI